jgi:hypothetical protein
VTPKILPAASSGVRSIHPSPPSQELLRDSYHNSDKNVRMPYIFRKQPAQTFPLGGRWMIAS